MHLHLRNPSQSRHAICSFRKNNEWSLYTGSPIPGVSVVGDSLYGRMVPSLRKELSGRNAPAPMPMSPRAQRLRPKSPAAQAQGLKGPSAHGPKSPSVPTRSSGQGSKGPGRLGPRTQGRKDLVSKPLCPSPRAQGRKG